MTEAPRPRDVFDFERLDVYRAAAEFLALARPIMDTLPRGRAFLGDELARAASSITHDIAEGAGEHSPREKARFHRIALRSATECAAILESAYAFGAVSRTERDRGRALLLRVVSMLTRLARTRQAASSASRPDADPDPDPVTRLP